MKQWRRFEYPTADQLEEEVERRQARAKKQEWLKNILLVFLGLLWAWAVLR